MEEGLEMEGNEGRDRKCRRGGSVKHYRKRRARNWER